jgi:hypothetical protein
MTRSLLKRGALAFGGAALLLSTTIGITQAHAAPTARPHIGKLLHQELALAATTIGLADVKALHTELAGSTLSAVALEHNVQPSTVAAALKADVEARIQALATAGTIRANRAATLKQKAEAKVDAFMTREFKSGKAKP